MFLKASKKAKEENKILLVFFGAEWCIWCHVFEQYTHGNFKVFNYTYGGPKEPESRYDAKMYEEKYAEMGAEAKKLNEFVSKTFVVVHIDIQYAPNGGTVMLETGADKHYSNGIPFIFTVSRNNKYAAHLDHDQAEQVRNSYWTDDWYRGFKRTQLLSQLKQMAQAAK